MTARTRKATSAAKATPAKVTATAAVASPWDALEAETIIDARPTGRTVDVEAVTPEPIKVKVLSAWNHSTEAKTAKFRTQRLATADQATEFVKLARRFATHRGASFKGGVVGDAAHNILVQAEHIPANTPTGTVVSYAVVDGSDSPVTRKRLTDDDRKAVVKGYMREKLSVLNLSVTYGVSTQTIRKVLTDNGVTLPDLRKGKRS